LPHKEKFGPSDLALALIENDFWEETDVPSLWIRSFIATTNATFYGSSQ